MIKEIESRRSIRRYKDIPVKKELIEEILKPACWLLPLKTGSHGILS